VLVETWRALLLALAARGEVQRVFALRGKAGIDATVYFWRALLACSPTFLHSQLKIAIGTVLHTLARARQEHGAVTFCALGVADAEAAIVGTHFTGTPNRIHAELPIVVRALILASCVGGPKRIPLALRAVILIVAQVTGRWTQETQAPNTIRSILLVVAIWTCVLAPVVWREISVMLALCA